MDLLVGFVPRPCQRLSEPSFGADLGHGFHSAVALERAIGQHGVVGITARQLQALEDRLAGRGSRSDLEPATSVAGAFQGIVLGLDPSLRGTGFGVVKVTGRDAAALDHGTIRNPKTWERSRCLGRISARLRELVDRWRPAVCAVEGLFHAQNLQTALVMGEARGAALSVLGEAGVTIHEIAPRRVKQAIAGYGAASKESVSRMVQRMLDLPGAPEPDAGDALALALTWVSESRSPVLGSGRRVL